MAGTKRAKIRKGDQVIVLAGRDKGRRGRVLEVKPAENRIKVEGVAVVKKHQKANSANNRGVRTYSAVWPRRIAACVNAQATNDLPAPVGPVISRLWWAATQPA